MALPPKYAGHRLLFTSSPPPTPLHTIEIYLDYVCPYSAKLFNTAYTLLPPTLSSHPNQTLPSSIQFIFRHQLQPWHPTSTLTHEAALAVLRLAPHQFLPFSRALFLASPSFYDVPASIETRNETYRRLAKLAAEATNGELSEDVVYGLLAIAKPEDVGEGQPRNEGNAVTADIKWVVKTARRVGVHVSPTVVVDGVVDDSVSSSWSVEQWVAFLEKVVGV